MLLKYKLRLLKSSINPCPDRVDVVSGLVDIVRCSLQFLDTPGRVSHFTMSD